MSPSSCPPPTPPSTPSATNTDQKKCPEGLCGPCLAASHLGLHCPSQPCPTQPTNTYTHIARAKQSLLDEPFDWFYWVEIEGFSNTVTDTKYPDYVLRRKSQSLLRNHSSQSHTELAVGWGVQCRGLQEALLWEQHLQENKVTLQPPLRDSLEGHRAFLSRARRGANQQSKGGIFKALLQLHAQMESLHILASGVLVSLVTNGKGSRSTEQCATRLLEEECKAGTWLRSTGGSRPRGHLVFTHRRALSDELVPPSPQGHTPQATFT